jgi:ATP-dependent helicase/nuclease subunit A
MHALFERLPEIAPDARTAAARRWLGRHAATWDADAREAMVAEVMAVIDNPAHAMLFAPGALAEVPLTAVVDKLVISGTVDRLHISHDLVHVVDFKTGLFVPRDAAAVAPAYLRQMAAYAAALEQIFPGRAVAASLLYTAGPRLITLDAALLAAHKPVYVPPNKS